jgi:phosphatidylglycerol:prolipoprotein diacylglycerol transferase
MHPVLFQAGPLTIYSYGVLVATGVLLGLWFARQQAPRAGLNPDKVWNLGIYIVLSALVVAKVWLVLSNWEYYAANPRQIFSIETFQSGGTFYGGIIGGIGTLILYTYFQKMAPLAVLDTLGPGMALGHAIGRLGCFAAGCCYGKPTTVAWSVVFKSELAEKLAGTPLGVHLHPTQLYEASVEFLNFLFLVWLGRRQKFVGQIAGAYFMLYGIERGIIEFFRGDPGRTMLFHGAVSLMQLVSVALILFGSFLWLRGLSGAAPLPPPLAAGAEAAR